MLPLRLPQSELPEPGSDHAAGVPIGVDELRLDPVYLDLAGGDPHFVVLGDAESGKSNFLRAFARGLAARQDPGRAQLVVVDYRRTLLDLADGPHAHAYAANASMAAGVASDLAAELHRRLPGPDASREELMRGSNWSGPRYYLLVDDYDLVPGSTDNPLLPLVDLLSHGRDVGFHLVLARRVGGVSRSAYEPFFQRITELRSPGLLMSGDPAEGPAARRPPGDAAAAGPRLSCAPRPPHRAGADGARGLRGSDRIRVPSRTRNALKTLVVTIAGPEKTDRPFGSR